VEHSINEEPTSLVVLQDGSVGSEARMGGKRHGSRTVFVRDGEQKGKILKAGFGIRSDAAHGLCSRVPSVAWLLRFEQAGGV